jgi:aminoglycoside phosphotransferase (APT) family kinase protein
MPDLKSVPFPELGPSQLADICAKQGLGQRRIGRMPSTGVVNSIYTLGDDLVLRVPKNTPEALSDTYTESVACPVAHAAGVSTPALVVWDESFEILDVPYTIHELVDGEPSQLDFDGPVWRDLGRDVARMHATVTDCPDPLGRLDDAGRADETGILEWAHGTEIQGWLERCLDRIRPLTADVVPEKFLHNDVSNTNVLHKGGEYAALIDWGDAAWGDPSLEFASLPMVAVMPMLAGYRELLPLEEVTTEARILWDKLVRIDRPVILEHMLAFRSQSPEPWRRLLE